MNIMRAGRLQTALANLSAAMREVEEALSEMRSEHDPLAVHIFVSRRSYRNTRVLKSGKPQKVTAHISWQTACEIGFRGDLREWERLLGANV